jgi:hypothetical protein
LKKEKKGRSRVKNEDMYGIFSTYVTLLPFAREEKQKGKKCY